MNESAELADPEVPQARRKGVALLPSAFLHAGLPLRDPGPGKEWVRSSPSVTLRLRPGLDPAGEPVGLPFGSIPRLLISWLTTEALKARSPEIRLGCTVGTFLSSLGYVPRGHTGGIAGPNTRVKEQMRRLFACRATIERHTGPDIGCGDLWAATPDLFDEPIGSMLTLSEFFMNEITSHAVPVDRATLLALFRSAFAVDIYWWLSWRFSFLRADQKIGWEQLQQQFGSGTQSLRKFRQSFLFALDQVRAVYPNVSVTSSVHGLTLSPSPPSVPMRFRRHFARRSSETGPHVARADGVLPGQAPPG